MLPVYAPLRHCYDPVLAVRAMESGTVVGTVHLLHSVLCLPVLLCLPVYEPCPAVLPFLGLRQLRPYAAVVVVVTGHRVHGIWSASATDSERNQTQDSATDFCGEKQKGRV